MSTPTMFDGPSGNPNDEAQGGSASVGLLGSITIFVLIFILCCATILCGSSEQTSNRLTQNRGSSPTSKKRQMTVKERRDVIEASLTTTTYTTGEFDGENGENRTHDVPFCNVMRVNEENSEVTRDNVDDNEHPGIEHQCAICLTNYEDGDKISGPTNGSCKHHFHHHCLTQWLMRKDDCPYCRQTVLTIPEPVSKEEGDNTDIEAGLSETATSGETASVSSMMTQEELR